ncbi:MAG: hypothetical protein IPK19_14930 [Chloroflexi bacterium]|nr:hypothetical protein [Chloroflexota bacterium]
MAAEQPIIVPDPVLGGVLAHHPSDRLKPLLTAAAVGAPIAVVLMLTSAQTDAWWGMPVTVGGVALVGLVLGWYVLHWWNREVILYQHGFSFREGSRVVYFAYHEVKWIGLQAQRLVYFGGLLRRDVYRVEVVTYAGDRVVLTNLYRRISDLAARLTEQVEQRLRPEIERRLAAGERITFTDDLSLSREEIVFQEERLPWTAFGGYRIGSGNMTLLKRDGTVFQEVPLALLYNVTILIELMRRYRPEREAHE